MACHNFCRKFAHTLRATPRHTMSIMLHPATHRLSYSRQSPERYSLASQPAPVRRRIEDPSIVGGPRSTITHNSRTSLVCRVLYSDLYSTVLTGSAAAPQFGSAANSKLFIGPTQSSSLLQVVASQLNQSPIIHSTVSISLTDNCGWGLPSLEWQQPMQAMPLKATPPWGIGHQKSTPPRRPPHVTLPKKILLTACLRTGMEQAKRSGALEG